MDKLISADSLWMTIIRAMDYCEDILEFIEKEPEAVVRCKDCKYADEAGLCGNVVWYNTEDDFCSRGERREG